MRAMVLAAGRSTRLHPLTARIAKPALPFLGVPILSRVLDGLAAAGVQHAVVNLHHAPASIREVVAARGDAPPRVTFSDESDELLGTGGALRPVRDLFRDGGPFLLVNGDCVHALDYRALLAQHVQSGASATLAVRAHAVPGFGCLRADETGRVTEFSAKPAGGPGEHHFLSAQVVSPELLDHLPDTPRSLGSFTHWYPAALRAGAPDFRVHVTAAEWHALDTADLYVDATRSWLDRRGEGPWIAPAARVHASASLDAGCAVHDGCVVEAAARLEGTTLLPRARVGERAELVRCLVGPGERIAARHVASDRLLACEP